MYLQLAILSVIFSNVMVLRLLNGAPTSYVPVKIILNHQSNQYFAYAAILYIPYYLLHVNLIYTYLIYIALDSCTSTKRKENSKRTNEARGQVDTDSGQILNFSESETPSVATIDGYYKLFSFIETKRNKSNQLF
jgi:hypothetical protein